MATMTKDAARSFLTEVGKLGDGLKKLLVEVVEKAEAKKPSAVVFPNDPKEGEPGSIEVRFFYAVFDEPDVLLSLSRAVSALSDDTLKLQMSASNAGNQLQLLKA